MFLDDELLLMCIEATADTEDNIQQLNVDICRKCEQYYKTRISPFSTRKEVKTVLNRTFNLFDSFVRKAKLHKSKKVQILGEMFEKFSFKQQLLSNEDMNRVYHSL